jgi:hypothetical protein
MNLLVMQLSPPSRHSIPLCWALETRKQNELQRYTKPRLLQFAASLNKTSQLAVSLPLSPGSTHVAVHPVAFVFYSVGPRWLVKGKVNVKFRPKVERSDCLVVKHHQRPMIKFLLLLDNCGFLYSRKGQNHDATQGRSVIQSVSHSVCFGVFYRLGLMTKCLKSRSK